MSNQRYPEEFKIEAVKQVTERGLPVAEVAARLGMSVHSLYVWIKRYSKPQEQRQQEDDQQAELRAFSKDTAPAQKLAAALPPPEPLSAATAVTPTLQAILKAHEAANEGAAQGQDSSGATGKIAQGAGWLDKVGDLLDDVAAATESGSAPAGQPSILETIASKGRSVGT